MEKIEIINIAEEEYEILKNIEQDEENTGEENDK